MQVNGVKIGPDQGLDGVPLLHDRWLLLRKGKRSYHLRGDFSGRRLTLRPRVGSVSLRPGTGKTRS